MKGVGWGLLAAAAIVIWIGCAADVVKPTRRVTAIAKVPAQVATPKPSEPF